MNELHRADSPLPTSPLLLEASAGTGKTQAIAELAVRYLETGVPIEKLLLLTFSKHATGELRHRVFGMLGSRQASTQGTARSRIDSAIADFDRAAIFTIHSFCQNILNTLGILGDWDGGETILTDPEELISHCGQDVYLQRYQDHARGPVTVRRARGIALSACGSTLPLQPPEAEPTNYAQAVRDLYTRRKAQAGLLSFDDPNARLRQLLDSPLHDDVVAELRQRYAVVLIDEFQDTDPEQWAMIEKAFIAPDRPTVMIGDPKQSIYGFRNADLISYARAASLADLRTLDVNYRSDATVVRAVEELFGDVRLGSESIRVTPVKARHQDRLRLDGAHPAGIWLRHGVAQADESANARIDADLAAHVQLLLGGAHLDQGDGFRPVTAHDIAILTRTRTRGMEIVSQLADHAIPAVWMGGESVLKSAAADQWAAIIEAMATRERTTVMLAAMTPLLGFTLEDLLREDKTAFADASRTIHEATRMLRTGPPGNWARTLLHQCRVAHRLAPTSQGPRLTTELEQVADALAGIPTTDAGELREVFVKQRKEASESSPKYRVATEESAVRVMTLHAAKGLQFPIVALPEVSHPQLQPWNPFQYVDDASQRYLWVGNKPGRSHDVIKRYEKQSREEELRLLYVGLTRAAHLAIMWHVMDPAAEQGALTALLARDPRSAELERSYASVPDLAGRFDPQLIDVAPIGTAKSRPLAPPRVDGPQLRAAAFSRPVDQTWRRTSYSGLTAGAHDEARGLDESDEVDVSVAASSPGLELISPMAQLPAGAAFGTAIHAAFEEIDWQPEGLVAETGRLARQLAPSMGLDDQLTEALGEALRQICLTPLGELARGRSLSEIPLSARLPELDFDLPMADAGPQATLRQLAETMRQHLADDDPLAEYPARLLSSGIEDAPLNGILTGSIDAVLQLEAGDFVIVDYKTNRFPVAQSQLLSVGHYQPQAMAEAMMQSHYPLQALLYGAALHRYLSWRLPGYDPIRHIRGVGYLFVRGMAGPETPIVGSMPCGVFTWRPSPMLFVAASEVLGGAR